MTVRRIDPETNDIATAGRQFITGREEVAQTVRTRLRLYLGEYFRDITDGTPWFNGILGKTGTLTVKDALLKRRIFETDGVLQIVTFQSQYDLDTRVYSVQAQILTTEGLEIFNLGQGFNNG